MVHMEYLDRPIAVTDVETSGLIAGHHEIVEIGLVLVDQKSFKILNAYEVKTKIDHPERFDEKARELNGYNEADWADAKPLFKAMVCYNTLAKEAIFCSHNITFDWGFIDQAYKQIGLKNLMDYHRLDTPTMAWLKLMSRGLTSVSLDNVAKFLGLEPEPPIHRAINGAMLAYEVLKKLKSM